MKPARLVAIAGMLLGNVLPGAARAEVADHLHCYKIKDEAAKAAYTADLTPADPPFAGASGCRINVPAKLLCVDVTKTNVTPAPPGYPPGPVAHKYLCYKVKCPRGELTLTGSDQFGSHAITVKQSSLVCAPFAPSLATRCCELPLGLCLDAVEADALVKCPLLGGTLAPPGQACAPGGGCGNTASHGAVCCECPAASPPFPHPQYCFETNSLVPGEMCPPGCTPEIGAVCDPVTESCTPP